MLESDSAGGASPAFSDAKVYLACLRVGHDFAARSLDDHATVMEHGNALCQIECRIHVVLDHYHGHIARNRGNQCFYRDALLERKSGKRLVEQQQLRLLRERHGDLDAALFAISDFADCSRGASLETDQCKHAARLFAQTGLKSERLESIPTRARHSEQRQHDIVFERVVRKERDDLIRSCDTAMRALVAFEMRDFFAE